MKNHNGDDIRYTDRYRHKYDSAMAEWLDSGPEADQTTGSTEWRGHVAQYGKRLLHSDDQGFVSVERFATEAEATDRFDAIDSEYGGWLDSDEDEDDHDPECTACDHDCPWKRHTIGPPYCSICDDHHEAAPDEDEADEAGEADASDIRCHDGADVNLSLGVPACLQATPIPGSRFNDWVTAHNRALDDYVNNRARRNETAVLALLDGILSYCGSHDSMGTGEDVDWYGAEHVLVPLLDGFDNALNFDLGRLDGGTLSGVSHAIRSTYAGGIGA